jgi:hypothetical protein
LLTVHSPCGVGCRRWSKPARREGFRRQQCCRHRETPYPFSALPLCLSRACLGKRSFCVRKLRKKGAVSHAPAVIDPVLLLTLAGSFSFLQNRSLLSSVFVLFSPKPVLATDHRLAVENRRNGTFSHRGVFILLLAQQQPLLGPALQLVHIADTIGAE